MIEIDGSYLEGGGQIVRTALALSMITQKAFSVKEIRKNRPNPGLKNQHLFCIKALQSLSNAQVEGALLGSTGLEFLPGTLKPRTLSIDIGTAGSISLLLQSILPPLIFAESKSRLKITGGTDTKWAMPFDYLNNLFLPHLHKYAQIQTKLLGRGYYPKGGGSVEIKIKPQKNESAQKLEYLRQHSLIQIKGISHASLDLQKALVVERQAKAAKLRLSTLRCPVSIRTEYSNSLSTGSGITLWAVFSKDPNEIDTLNPIRIGADALGERGKRAEEVGSEAAARLTREIESEAPIDSHLADNLIPFLALKGGKIRVSQITNHTLTNIYTCEAFLGKIFSIDKENKIISAQP
jgi:RNA 3'-terminal phosphate cyclase (GTP)